MLQAVHEARLRCVRLLGLQSLLQGVGQLANGRQGLCILHAQLRHPSNRRHLLPLGSWPLCLLNPEELCVALDRGPRLVGLQRRVSRLAERHLVAGMA